MSFVVDHIIPLSKGGADTLENKAAAHRKCNRIKSDRTDEPRRTFITHRRWTTARTDRRRRPLNDQAGSPQGPPRKPPAA